MANIQDDIINIKREKIKNTYYWVRREDGKIIEKVKYKKGVLKSDVIKAFKRRGLIDPNILKREESTNYIKTITRERPNKTSRTQYKAEFEVWVNGKKLNRPLLEPYVGISRQGISEKQGKLEAKKNAFNYTKARLMSRGIMKSYEDSLELREVRKAYITRKVKS